MNRPTLLLIPLMALVALLFAGAPAHAVEPTAPHASEATDVELAGEAHGDDHGDPSLISGAEQGLVPAITTLIVFALLLAVLGKFAWGPIANSLQEREDRIRNDIAAAEEARRKAEASQREYAAQLDQAEQRVRELMAQAQADGQQLANRIKMQAQEEAQEIKERATREIEQSRREAIEAVRTEAAVLATAVAEKILRREVSSDDQRRLVDESLDALQTVER